MIVSTIAKDLHPFVNAGLRFVESAIGTGIAVVVALVAFYTQDYVFRQKAEK
jgi:uncharacterized membrane protein YgaE (UPF0421/DUF939 family)